MPPSVPAPAPSPGTWWVYVLWSDGRGRTYVGTTTDVERRLRQHNGEIIGGARSTTAGRPWRLVANHGPFPDRSEASRAEHLVKRRRGLARLTWTP